MPVVTLNYSDDEQPIPFSSKWKPHPFGRYAIRIGSKIVYHEYRLNFSFLMWSIKERARIGRGMDIELLNCAADCFSFSDIDSRFISPIEKFFDRSRLSRMMSEESNPPIKLYNAINDGDFECFGGPARCLLTTAGFSRILDSIASYDSVHSLIRDVTTMIDKDLSISKDDKKYLIDGDFSNFSNEDENAAFLSRCFLFTLRHGNNTVMRAVRDEIRELQKAAKQTANQLSDDIKNLYHEEDSANKIDMNNPCKKEEF